MSPTKIVETTKKALLYSLIFIFPFFMTTLVQEFYLTGKFYFLIFSTLIILALSTIQFIFAQKISLKKSPFDLPLIIFLGAVTLSTFLLAPNKVDSILYVRAGLAVFLALSSLYYLLVNNISGRILKQVLLAAAALLSIVTIIFLLHPFSAINLPDWLKALKEPGFTPLGSQLDLSLSLGYFLMLVIYSSLEEFHREEKSQTAILSNSIYIFLITIACVVSIYTTVSLATNPQTAQSQQPLIRLAPASVSWLAAVDSLKDPRSLFLGAGPGNFVSVFSRVKPASYNKTPFWNVNFTQSRSFILQLWAETGLVGLFAFGSIIFIIIKRLLGYLRSHEEKAKRKLALIKLLPTIYLLLILLFFPASLPILFLFFVNLSLVVKDFFPIKLETKTLDFADFKPLYAIGILISILILVIFGYLSTRSFLSEYYFKKSIDSFASNNAQLVYNNLRSAISSDPYIERYRASFANLNIILANNLATALSKKQKPSQKEIDKERKNISDLIQAAISEGKATVALNPQKTANWENLALIYRNILNSVAGADTWTISAYQRAIVTDPVNPTLRVSLGGVYYSIGNYDEAITLFRQGIYLKDDWPNASYNLAWTYFQKADYKKAISTMETTINLIDPKSADYKRASKELQTFKDKLASVEAVKEEASHEGELKKEAARIEESSPEISPKLELPVVASPEANPSTR